MKINFQIPKYNMHRYKCKNQINSNQNIPINNKINFGAFRCTENNFEVRNIPNLHCPVCGLLMLNDEEQMAFANDIASKKGQELKDALEKYEDETVFIKDPLNNRHRTIYRPQKQKIVDMLKELALKYPTLNIAELVRIAGESNLGELIEKQLIVFDEIENFIKNNPEINDEQKALILSALYKHKQDAIGKTNKKFKRKEFIDDITSLISNSEIKRQLSYIASKIPTSNKEISAFFVKYSDPSRTPKEIAGKLVIESVPSTEHLIPKSKQGTSRTDNYICDCASCNTAKGNILFEEWMEDKENLQEGLQRYLEDVQKALDKGDLNPKYKSYIKEIIETISRISKGKIKLTEPPSTNNKKLQDIFARREFEIEKISHKIGEMIEKIKILKREVSALEKNPQFENISQHQIVTEKIKKLKLQIQSLKEQLETNQNEKQQCLDALTKITELEMLLDNTTDEYQAAQIENEIQTLNKTLQLKKLSRYDYKITQLLTQIESLEAEIKNLNQKKEILEDMISSNLPTKQTLEELQTLISEMEEALSQIENLKDCIFDKPMLEERLSEIRQENERLEQENKTILERGEINTEDKDKQKEDYKEYKHYAELFEAAVQLEEYFKSKNSTIPPKSAFEISRMAQKEIESKLDELSKKSSVRYFINLNTLSDNQEEEQLILARLKEIEKTSEEIEKLNQTYREKYSNASFEETKQLYQKLKSEIETQEKIRKISEIRTELKNIQDTLSYNLKVLTILKKKYRALNDTDYQRLTSLLFY